MSQAAKIFEASNAPGTCLGFQADSAYYPHRDLPFFEKVAIFDICGGMGGFTMGSEPAGIETLAFLDSNALACEVLRANFKVPVIHGSVMDPLCIQELHAMKTDAYLQITGGFPCQPYSRQGDLQGLRDQRGSVLSGILRCAWHLQADSLLLECVDNVMHFHEIQQILDFFAETNEMHIHKMVFDLEEQWPVRRSRFWCLMYSKAIPEMILQGWPKCQVCQQVGNVMPFDAVWHDDHEQELEWDQDELAVYFDSRFGRDIRVLLPQHQAPTVLHSWSNVLRACPCGCRDAAFSQYRLLQGGARGFGIVSAKTQRLRHLHAEEGALLCTVPLTYKFPTSMRAALCLLGQIAAPMQVLWIQSQFVAHLQESFWLTSKLQPLALLHQYKHGLLQQRLQRWTLASMDLPRQLHLELDEVQTNITVRSPTTAVEVERAETQMIGRGFYVIVTQHGQRLPPWCQLHAGERYQLQVLAKRQALPSSILGSTTLGALGHTDESRGMPTSGLSGLGDTHIWASMKALMTHIQPEAKIRQPMTLYPFRALQLLHQQLPTGLLTDWQHRFTKAEGNIIVIYEYLNHWTWLVGELSDRLHWCHYDGLRTDDTDAQIAMANRVAHKLSSCLGLDMGNIHSRSIWTQRLPFTCGTIALCHLAEALQLPHCLPQQDEMTLHHTFLTTCMTKPTWTADGKAQDPDSLISLLESKGVPAKNATERAKQVREKLGQHQVQQALRANNPWAALKAAASKPGKMFRLVTEAELQDYINERAQTKHGAKVQHPKAKKQASQKSGPVQLDPDDFKLDAKHFQDEDGQSVQQIHFQEVEADQTGVALCTTTMAKHFLEHPDKISLSGLALLLIDVPSQKIVEQVGLEPIIFPALCVSTEEHTIIMGHILQLGDKTVKRKMAGKESEPDKIDTQVIKIQIYRDELEVAWDRFITAPVRLLIQAVETMQLCKGQNCGLECNKFHAGLDEMLDAVVLEVWSRSFLDDNGKKAEPSTATIFTVFLRIPETALLKILTSSPPGIYIEPRGKQPREYDERYKVIWLPGATFAEAQHQCRTYSKSLCLVRLKNKYGIRVKQCDEAAACAKLRPGVEFVDMSIQKIFEIFPLPHGTQRAAINKILSDWAWKARALQPGRGNFHHMAWRIGSAVSPPDAILTAFGSDVIIKEVRDLQVQENKPTIYAPAKTQKHLREQPAASTAKSSGSSDPWLEHDPWGGYHKTATPAGQGRTYKAAFQDQIRETVENALKEKQDQDFQMNVNADEYTTEQEQRFVALESGLHELKSQNGQFLQWFQQTGDKIKQNEQMMQDVQDNVQQHACALQLMSASLSNAEHSITEVHQTLNAHQQEIHAMGTNFSSTMRSMKEDLSGELMQSFDQQFNKLEALLEKRHKTG